EVLQRPQRLAQRRLGEPILADDDVAIAGQEQLRQALANLTCADRRLAHAGERDAEVVATMSGAGELREHLLRSLDANVPIDRRATDDVRPARHPGGLAVPARRCDHPSGSCWLLASVLERNLALLVATGLAPLL